MAILLNLVKCASVDMVQSLRDLLLAVLYSSSLAIVQLVERRTVVECFGDP